uniref:Protein kinase domain-containing protein n=1 Tax=Meloidogyne enterolobii TaxID=390850 RepID=A0A6V7Y7I1_MELEN|nr:unnamed protein product [Meloidogyne enterolobii]
MIHFAGLSKAPEIAYTNQISQKADIWAFGLMVYILFNNKCPIDYYHANEIMEEYRSNTELNTKLDRVIKACVQYEPSDRPTMKEIVQFLNDEIEYFGYEFIEMERLENERVKKERLEEEQRKKVERRQKHRNRFFCGLC